MKRAQKKRERKEANGNVRIFNHIADIFHKADKTVGAYDTSFPKECTGLQTYTFFHVSQATFIFVDFSQKMKIVINLKVINI